MLLWLHPTTKTTNSLMVDNNNHDDGEKGTKILRHKAYKKQMLQLLVLIIVFIITLSVVTTMQYHHHNYHPHQKVRGGIRRSKNYHQDTSRNSNHKNLNVQNHRIDAVVGDETLSNRRVPKQQQQQQQQQYDAVLPINSIYRLSLLDINENLQSLQKYIGMVTLIVNTACK
jgi:hypothetical protein